MIVSRRHFVRLAAASAALGVVAGCARPAPIKGTYILEPALPPPVARPQPGLLRVGSVAIAAPYRGRSFVYRESDLKYETDYYHEFLVAPAANITDATVRALTAAKVFAVVAPPGVAVDADWVLDGFVESLYGDGRTPAKPSAVLRITWFLRPYDGNAGVPLWTRSYERAIPFTTGSAAAYVEAQNQALAEILAELARDLAAVKLPVAAT